jgi:hypothetical protein
MLDSNVLRTPIIPEIHVFNTGFQRMCGVLLLEINQSLANGGVPDSNVV